MKKTHSTTFLASAFVASLLLVPSFAEAKSFGYTNLKAGYSYESFPQTIFTLNAGPKTSLQKSSSAGIPLGLSVGFGYYFTPSFGLRVEAEYVYRLEAKFKGDIFRFGNSTANPDIPARPRAQIQSLLGNVYLDYYVLPSVNFYLSAGMGSGFIGFAIDWYNPSLAADRGKLTALKKSALAWQVGGGMGVALGQNLGLDFNVRYVDFGKAQIRARGAFSASADIPFSSLEAFVGLSYRF